MSPTRLPEISRPVYPQTTMATVPRMQHHTRSAKNVFSPSADGMATTKMNSGGNDAVWTAWWAPWG